MKFDEAVDRINKAGSDISIYQCMINPPIWHGFIMRNGKAVWNPLDIRTLSDVLDWLVDEAEGQHDKA